jgi:hypothetical protein
MPAEAWVVIGGVILAGMAGAFWSARQHDKMAASYQTQIDAAHDVHGRSQTLLDRHEEMHRRSLALLDRQEELLRRAESLMDRLEKRGDSG